MTWLFSKAMMEDYGNSHSSPERVEEYSAGTSLAGEPLSQLNVTPTQHKFWRNDKTIDASDHSRFGLTSQLLTAARGAELLMSYLAAFRARTSARLERVPDWKGNAADCGPKWHGSFARFDRASSTWKTVQCSLLGDSESFSETWPRWGLMHDGVSSLQQTPALPICVSASGLWPTPTVYRNHNQPGASKSAGWGLSSAAKLWTTPSASDARRGGTITPNMTGTSLAQQVKTPAFWPTPTAINFSGGAALCKWGGAGARKKLATMVTPEEMNGPLNPMWVEWLMGWPAGWTDLKPLEMAKFREWQQQHGSF